MPTTTIKDILPILDFTNSVGKAGESTKKPQIIRK
jgi:hypothetical protein